MADGQQIDSAQGSVGGGERTISLRSRKSGSGSAQTVLSGQQVSAVQGAFGKTRSKALTGSSVTGQTGVVTSPGTVSTAQDWVTRSTASGVLRAFDFSTSDQLGTLNGQGLGYSTGSPTGTFPELDLTMFAHQGGGSLKFSTKAFSDQRTSGEWYSNFAPGTGLATISDPNFGNGYKFHANSEFYIQWRSYKNTEFLTADPVQFGGQQIGLKSFILSHMDGPGANLDTGTPTAKSSDTQKLVLTTLGSVGDNVRFPVMYRYYPSPGVGNSGLDESGFGSQPWSFQPGGVQGPTCNYPGPYGEANCFMLRANQWDTYTLRVKLGAAGLWDEPTGSPFNGNSFYENRPVFLDSEVQLWVTRPGGTRQLVLDWKPGTEGYRPLLRETGATWNYGKLWFGNFCTNKDNTQNHATMIEWITDVIVSSEPIADPVDIPVPAWVPTTSWQWATIPGTRWSDYMKDDGSGIAPVHGSSVESGDNASYRGVWADSGPCYSPKRKEVYLIGGGHASTSNNILGRWNLGKASPDMDVAEQPTAHAIRVAEASTAELQARNGYYTDGRPIAFHSYHNLAYFDGIDELVSAGLTAANWTLANGNINFWVTAGWPRNGDWRAHGYWPNLFTEPSNTDPIALVFKHPTQDLLYYSRGGGPLRRLDASARTWTTIGGNGPGSTYQNCAGLNPSTNEALVLRKNGASGYGARFLNINTGAFTEVTVNGATYPSGTVAIDVHWINHLGRWIGFYGANAGSPAVQWKLIAFQKTGSNTVSATDITPANAPTTLQQRTGMYYDPDWRALIFASDYNELFRVVKVGTSLP